jgi:hypothetical protein
LARCKRRPRVLLLSRSRNSSPRAFCATTKATTILTATIASIGGESRISGTLMEEIARIVAEEERKMPKHPISSADYITDKEEECKIISPERHRQHNLRGDVDGLAKKVICLTTAAPTTL